MSTERFSKEQRNDLHKKSEPLFLQNSPTTQANIDNSFQRTHQTSKFNMVPAPNAKTDTFVDPGISTVEDNAKTMTEEEKNIAMIQGALAAWGKS